LTLDHWCKSYYQAQIGGPVPWDDKHHQADYGAIRRAVLAAQSGRPPVYEFVLVDEGQDLDRESFELLKKVGKHITVCVDQKQQIYDRGSTEAEIVRTLSLRRANVTLLDAFRCCPYIVQVAAAFVPNDAERAAFLNQGRTAQSELQTPLLYMARDFDDEKKRLIEIVRERQVVDERIAILFPLNNQVNGFATELRRNGLEVETRDGGVLDFSSGVPKVLTVYSAKGLTFDTVIMPRLRPASFPLLMPKSGREKLLFVGITRATKWVYLSAEDGRAIGELDRLRALALLPNAPITIQSWRDSRGEDATVPPRDPLDLL
jgi:superfamily I DNA/RNA helicase